MAKGAGPLIGLLAIITVLLASVFGVVAWVALLLLPDPASPSATEDPLEIFWTALIAAFEPSALDGVHGWIFRILMLALALLGIVIFAGLIGVVSGAFDRRVASLQKGRSEVLEREYTLILGWNNKISTIVEQLTIANESRKRPVVVILADRDQVEMEDTIRAAVTNMRNTRLVCRTGDPKSTADLAIVQPQSARSIIILASETAKDPDAEVIKTALALTRDPNRGSEPYTIVGELRSEQNLEVARLAGGDETDWVLGTDLIGRLIVQSCRQPGLAVVYQDLLNFAGSEFYFSEQPNLVGATFLQAQLSFADTIVVGIDNGDTLTLNPRPDTKITAADHLVVIAEDDSTIRLAEPGAFDPGEAHKLPAPSMGPEHTIILGKNPGLNVLLRELDQFVAPGSTAQIVTTAKVTEPSALTNLSLTHLNRDPTLRTTLDRLEFHGSNHVVVLAETGRYEPAEADNRTLVTLLHLRDIENRNGYDLNVVSEMLDDQNRALAEVTEADDFVVSDRIVALALAQVSEDRRVKRLYDQLFQANGSEVYLRPAELYVGLGAPVDFYAVLSAASQRAETAIGFRLASRAHDPRQNYGILINPVKTDLVTFAPGDVIVVMAED
jgi:voltage-gated potassium channel Kch